MQSETRSEEHRPIRPLGLWGFGDWRMKAYGIAYGKARPGDRLIDAAGAVAEKRLRDSGPATSHYGVGFVGVHEGKTAHFVFVDWWADENELHHHVYVASLHRPTALDYRTPTGLAACVWDLRVLAFERDAWVAALARGEGVPDREGYLTDWLDEP